MEQQTGRKAERGKGQNPPSRRYLIRVGEITLKKGNRAWFEKKLKQNIKGAVKPYSSRVTGSSGRFYLETADAPEEEILQRLSQTPGIVSIHPVRRVPKETEAIEQAALELIADQRQHTSDRRYKVEARRSDKGFPLNSYQLACRLGSAAGSRFPDLQVDVKNPDWTLHAEIRDHAYLYCGGRPGPGGLPVGTAGKALLLLSGGIDSPVAGYLMALRGLKIEAVYFHTPPYTSEESTRKVESLAQALAPWNQGIVLHAVPFTEVQVQINRQAPLEETTLHTRAAMMRIAQALAEERGAGALITGESLSQVASQTIESLRFTGSYPPRPVLRPLLGLSKEQILRIARTIGTFDTSTLPYDDCCVLFSPKHPTVRPAYSPTRQNHEALALAPLLDQARQKAARRIFKAAAPPPPFPASSL